ncbi:MAG TPA: GYF domain-containing protein [Chthoniobacter sp.]|nr:GYF domain-containing protein [Chthoniobacter sp.]
MDYYFSADGVNTQGPTPQEDLAARVAQGTLPSTTQVCAVGGQAWQPISSILSAPSVPPPPLPQVGDATGGVIPYKNLPALIGYYLGIFGLIPFIGLLLAIPAFILGIVGLRKRKKNPIIKGSVHAWIGIVLGFISIAYHSLFIVAMVMSRKH